MRVRLKERRRESADVMSFIFDLCGQPFEYLPGQYAFYELDKLAFPDERGNRRHFTISSSPTEKGIIMFTTRLRGSGFKETLHRARMGYGLTVTGPEGDFVLPGVKTRQHVFIAGGIGVTPFRSMMRNAADIKTPIHARLLHFSRSVQDLVFRNELEEIASKMPSFSYVCSVEEADPGWQGDRGVLTEAFLRGHVADIHRSLFWISGPPPAVEAFKQVVRKTGVPEKSIRTDDFTGYESATRSDADVQKGSRRRKTMPASSFATDILPLFRPSDIKAMKPEGIDLSSYAVVKKRAKDIYRKLSAKGMPCDGPWSKENIRKFKKWMDDGMKP